MGYTSLPDNVQFVSTNYYLCNVNIPLRESLYLFVQDSCGQSVFMEITPEMLQHRDESSSQSWDIAMSPNPVSDVMVLRTIEDENTIQTFELYDVYGKLILRSDTKGTTIGINISDFASGIYVVRVLTEKGDRVKMIVKQ